ncbi:MAG: flavodoxin family protein [Candidatus Scalinduaceae bacterium]
MSKALGIAGSPRKNGNTELLLKEFLRGAKTSDIYTELYILSELNISPCTSCDSCQKDGQCVIDDDMQLMYCKLLEADYVVLASPIYFKGVSSQMKAFIDRCQALWSRKYILKQKLIGPDRSTRIGYFIATAGSTGDSNVFRGAITTIKAIFHVLDIEYKGELLFHGMEKKGDIIKHPNALQIAFETGISLKKDT